MLFMNNRNPAMRILLTLADLADRGTKFFPGWRQVPVFGSRDANAHGDISVDQVAIHKSLADRLLKKLADNRHALSNADFSDKRIYAVTFGGNVGMARRKN